MVFSYGVTGKNLYAIIFHAESTSVWNSTTSASVVYDNANFADYDVPLTEIGTSGSYRFTFPVSFATDARIHIEIRDRATGTPLVTDPIVGQGDFYAKSNGTVVDLYDTSPTWASDTAAIADKILGRNLAGGSDGGRTVRDALRPGRNKVAFDTPAAGQFTVYAENYTTVAWIGTFTRGPNTSGPLITIDPA
jgi:hypothetical protein